MTPTLSHVLGYLSAIEEALEDSAPIDRLRLLAALRQAMADLKSLEVGTADRAR